MWPNQDNPGAVREKLLARCLAAFFAPLDTQRAGRTGKSEATARSDSFANGQHDSRAPATAEGADRPNRCRGRSVGATAQAFHVHKQHEPRERSIESQPRPAKSARTLLMVSREAPTSCANSPWVRSCRTYTPPSDGTPNRAARSSRTLATRRGVSWKTRSPTTSVEIRCRRESWRSKESPTSGRCRSHGRRSEWPNAYRRLSVTAVAVADRGPGSNKDSSPNISPGPSNRSQVGLAVAGRATELDLPLEDHEEPVPDLALAEQHLPAVQPQLGHRKHSRSPAASLSRAENSAVSRTTATRSSGLPGARGRAAPSSATSSRVIHRVRAVAAARSHRRAARGPGASTTVGAPNAAGSPGS